MNCHPANPSLLRALALGATGFLLSGCAVHYYDKTTGTEHLWGFGHFRMKGYPQNPEQPLVTGTHMLGLNIRASRDDYGVGVGFDSSSRIIVPANGTLCLEWPTNVSPLPREMRDLFTVRVGTNLPPDWETKRGTNSTNQPITP